MSDCISRQAAIDVVNSIDNLDAKAKGGICINLMGLPPAQPERKVGEWVQVPRFEGDTQPYLECPFCKNQVGWWDLARYCNGCGAKLEGGAG